MVKMYKSFVIALLACFSVSVHAANLLNVTTSNLSGGTVRVALQFDSAPYGVSSYQIGSPAQVVVDFPGSQSGRFDVVNLPSPLGALSLVNTDQTMRAVVSMAAPYNFAVNTVGNQVYIDVGAAQNVAGSVYSTPNLSSSLDVYSIHSNQVSNIDFKKRSNNSGEIVIYSDKQVDADIERSGGRVELLLKDVQLPSRFSKRFDVNDFSTPIQYFTAVQEGGNVKVIVYPKGEFEYFGYQANGFYSINVAEIPKEELERIKEEQKVYSGERLDFNFQAIDVRQALQIIAEIQNKNLVVDDSVSGEVTMNLKKVPWDQALDLILASNDLGKVDKGNVLFIAPKAKLAAEEAAKLKSKQEVKSLEPILTEFFEINYAKADELLDLIREAKFTSARGTSLADDRTNTLIVSDTADKLESIRQMLAKVDVPVRQVLIEARMVLANEDFSEALGVNWNASNIFSNENVSVNTASVDLSAPGATSALTLGISDLASGLLDLEISAQETVGNGEVISSPKILTSDKQQASISSGSQVPFTTVSQNGTNVQFIDAVLSLDVTPQITPDGSIIMDIEFTNDTPQQISTGEFVIDTNQLATQVLVDNGQTVVLGGVFSQDEQETVAKTPLLGDIPLIGHLFRRTVETTGKRELLIFITPKLVDKDAF